MSADFTKVVPDTAPFSPEQIAWLNAFLPALQPEQAAWLGGYLAGARVAAAGAPLVAAAATAAARLPLSIFYGTESGNAENLAMEARKQALRHGFDVTVRNMADGDAAMLAGCANMLLIVSTWGEGDPPERVTPFYRHLMGGDAPTLRNSRFSVLALGDTSYEHFCKIGKDMDARLEALGAHRIHARRDCDVDFEKPFEEWLGGVLRELDAIAGERATATPAPLPAQASAAPHYDKKHPFPARLTERIVLNGTGSSKETVHLELSLEGSGLTYEPGDSLGILPANCPAYIEGILRVLRLNGSETVTREDGTATHLAAALRDDCDVTALNRTLVERYAAISGAKKLQALLDPQQRDALNDYLWGRQIVDLLEEFPVPGFGAQDLVRFLRRLPPRLYSIASSLKATPAQVHLCVAAVRYSSHGKERKGVCSTFLADRVESGSTFPVYVHRNNHFRLPLDPRTPVIMVGPGTGVAPFRAFMQERAATGAKGRNWLFFGDQHATHDFLYQLEWQDYLKDGLLTRLDVAFSRDQPEKIYVQHRMLERGKELFAWLQEGAHFYVCGDARRMAPDVQDALLRIASTHGGMNPEQALAWLESLSRERRYLRDVY